MPSDNPTLHIPAFPRLPKDGKEFFNLLMGQIEPDLTLDHVTTLDSQYAEESDSEHAARMERYKKALNTYRAKRDQYFASFAEEVRKFSRDLSAHSEGTVRALENKHLKELESQFL